jgi:hypothetical protein
MRLVCLALAFVMLVRSPASAQTTTADGLAAMLAGDYASAARIFRPLAEDAASPDPLATFFLAMLYHGGRGVHRDEFHACGLFLRAAVPENPFSAQSLTLARAIHQDHPLGIEECTMVRDFRWNRPSDATFMLASDHWVLIDSNELVVGYQGAQKSVGILSAAGWVFLSTRHTQVEVSAGARELTLYQATVQIVDAEFMSATGTRVRLPGPVTLSATVGIIWG